MTRRLFPLMDVSQALEQAGYAVNNGELPKAPSALPNAKDPAWDTLGVRVTKTDAGGLGDKWRTANPISHVFYRDIYGTYKRRGVTIMPKARTPEERSADPAAVEVLKFAEEFGLGTAFSRADAMQPCPIGADGLCCKNCFMDHAGW